MPVFLLNADSQSVSTLSYVKDLSMMIQTLKKIIHTQIMSLMDATNALFVIWLCMASQYSNGHIISVICLRYSANHSALNNWPNRAHLAFQTTELCKNRHVSEGGA